MTTRAFNTTLLFYPTKSPRLRLFALWYFTTLMIVWNLVGHLVLGFEQSWAAPLVAVFTAIAVSMLFDWVDARARDRELHFAGSLGAFLNFLPACLIHDADCGRGGDYAGFAAASARLGRNVYRCLRFGGISERAARFAGGRYRSAVHILGPYSYGWQETPPVPPSGALSLGGRIRWVPARLAWLWRRLREAWRTGRAEEPTQSRATAARASWVTRFLGPEAAARLDRFDRAQLEEVLGVCLESASLSEAGRRLFEVSRTRKTSTNDADRLRKYLARFELEWSALKA